VSPRAARVSSDGGRERPSFTQRQETARFVEAFLTSMKEMGGRIASR